MPDLVTFSIRTNGTTMAQSVTDARGFKIYMDEPKDLGGDDRAPSPLDLILAAHGACLNYMCFYIADQLGLKIRGTDISVEAGLDPGRFSGQNMDNRAGYQQFKVKIGLDTDASPEEVENLRREVEMRCPVSDNISNATDVKIEMSAN